MKFSCLFPLLLAHYISGVQTMSFSLNATFSFCTVVLGFFLRVFFMCVESFSICINGRIKVPVDYPPLFQKMVWQRESVVHALLSELYNVVTTLVPVLKTDTYIFSSIFIFLRGICETLSFCKMCSYLGKSHNRLEVLNTK